MIYKKKRGFSEVVREEFDMDIASSSHEPQRLPKKRKLANAEDEDTISIPSNENSNDFLGMLPDPQ